MMKKCLSTLLLLLVTVGVYAVFAEAKTAQKGKRNAPSALIITKDTTITNVSGYQGVNVTFEPGEEVDMENFTYKHTMGQLLLDAPASVKWQIGRFTLPVNFFSYETNYDYEDWDKNEDVYAIGTMLNQRTPVEAQQIEMKINDTQDNTWLRFHKDQKTNTN